MNGEETILNRYSDHPRISNNSWITRGGEMVIKNLMTNFYLNVFQATMHKS